MGHSSLYDAGWHDHTPWQGMPFGVYILLIACEKKQPRGILRKEDAPGLLLYLRLIGSQKRCDPCGYAVFSLHAFIWWAFVFLRAAFVGPNGCCALRAYMLYCCHSAQIRQKISRMLETTYTNVDVSRWALGVAFGLFDSGQLYDSPSCFSGTK